MSEIHTEVDGRDLKLTNLEKVLWPETGFTKGEMVEYYAQIADVVLPHLYNRPLTLKRYPNGVAESFFFEKNAPKHRPDWVLTHELESGSETGRTNYVIANDRPTLVWLANLAAIELHPLLATLDAITRPTAVVFDLDPGAPAAMVECCEVALILRDAFEHFGLQTFPKTSGSKGLQLYVPLNTPTAYDDTKMFAHLVAIYMERAFPELIVEKHDFV